MKGIQTMAGAKGNQTLVARLPWALVVRALGDGRVVDARAVHRAASARECALRSHARAPVTRARRWTKTVSAGFPAVYGNALLLMFNPPRASLRCALARSAGPVSCVKSTAKCFDHGFDHGGT